MQQASFARGLGVAGLGKTEEVFHLQQETSAALGQGTVLLCQLERRCLLTPLLVPRAGHGAGWDGSPPLKPRTGHDEAVALTEGLRKTRAQ